jgi:hypothetical protein
MLRPQYVKIELGDTYWIHLVMDTKQEPGYCENGIGPLGSSKNREFFDPLRKYVLNFEEGLKFLITLPSL